MLKTTYLTQRFIPHIKSSFATHFDSIFAIYFDSKTYNNININYLQTHIDSKNN